MTHSIRWHRSGWSVVSALGSMVVSAAVFASYGDALAALVSLQGAA